jgi:hypothetical protein
MKPKTLLGVEVSAVKQENTSAALQDGNPSAANQVSKSGFGSFHYALLRNPNKRAWFKPV